MHCPIASQTMDQRDQDAVQDRMLAGKSVAGLRRLGAVEHPCASANRRPSGLAAKCGRSDLDFWVVTNPLQLPGRIPGAHEGSRALDGNVHRSADWRAVAAIGG